MAFLKFLTDPRLGNFPEISPPQRVLAKCVGGEELVTAEEKSLYKHHTGSEYEGPIKGQMFLWLWGRRGGKSRTAGYIAVKECITGGHEKYLAPGETGTFLIIAQNKRNATIIFNYCKHLLTTSVLLKGYLRGDPVGEVIRLQVNGKPLEIRIQTADKASVRGWTVIGFIGDEVASWQYEGINVDKQVFDAIEPGATTMPDAKFIFVTTPWIKQGMVWEIFKACWGKTDADWWVFRGATEEMHNHLTPKALAKMQKIKKSDPEKYAREYMAEFTDPIHGWLGGAIIDMAVSKGVRERKYDPKFQYVAAMDPAFVHDAYTFTITHKNEHDECLQDHVSVWKAESKRIAIDAVSVIRQVAEMCKKYHVNTLYTDQGSSEVLMQFFDRSKAWQGIRTRIERIYVTAPEKREEFNTLKNLILNGKMRLLDHEQTLFELKNIEVKERAGGGCTISAPRLVGYTDDIACALAMSTHYCYTGLDRADHEFEGKQLDRLTAYRDVELNEYTGATL